MWLLILKPLFYILILFFSITQSISCKEAFVGAWAAASWQEEFWAADLPVLIAWLKNSPIFIWVEPHRKQLWLWMHLQGVQNCSSPQSENRATQQQKSFLRGESVLLCAQTQPVYCSCSNKMPLQCTYWMQLMWLWRGGSSTRSWGRGDPQPSALWALCPGIPSATWSWDCDMTAGLLWKNFGNRF